MNLLDMVILGIILFFLIRGIFRGFFREAGSLAGVVLGIWLANIFQPQMTKHLQEFLPPFGFLSLISFVIIFMIVLISCNLIGWGFRLVFRRLFLLWADRTLGGSLAVIKGVIIVYLLIVIMTFFVPTKARLIAESTIAPLIITSYQSMTGLISQNFYKRWKNRVLGYNWFSDSDLSRENKGDNKVNGSK